MKFLPSILQYPALRMEGQTTCQTYKSHLSNGTAIRYIFRQGGSIIPCSWSFRPSYIFVICSLAMQWHCSIWDYITIYMKSTSVISVSMIVWIGTFLAEKVLSYLRQVPMLQCSLYFLKIFYILIMLPVTNVFGIMIRFLPNRSCLFSFSQSSSAFTK